MQRLRHLTGNSGHGPAVVQLGGQHPLLHMAGEHREQRQHQQQDHRKAGVLHGDDREDRENAARIGHHADDTGREQRFHSVHIARKAGRHLAGVLGCQRTGGQPGQLPGHLRAEGVGHFLAEEDQQTFLRRGEPALQCKAAEVGQHGPERQREAGGELVDDAGQQQWRQQRRRH